MDRSFEPEIQHLIGRRADNGGPFWSRADGNIHAPAGFSTIDVLTVLGELGATVQTHAVLREAVNLILGHQSPEGGIRYAPSSSVLPCITGQALAALGRLGVRDDPRCEASFTWLLEHQEDDGGWRCATVRRGRSAQTDASNPGATLFVLDAFRLRQDWYGTVPSQIDEAVDSLLHHWETRAPLGPCLFGIGSRFMRTEYPFLRYNLFFYVYVLSHYPRALGDPRFEEALAQLSAHTRQGELVVDAPHRAWQSGAFARKGQPSVLATRRWVEIRANVDKA